MKRLFANANLRALHQLSRSDVLLAFDFDGTLAPIVADRELAGMRERTEQLFSLVCEHYPCAVISGRSRADVAARLAGARVKHVSGNHGIEPGGDLAAYARDVGALRLVLEHRLSGARGIEIEDKGYSLAVHYRTARSKRRAREQIHQALTALQVRVVAGKQVVNVLPEHAAHKGTALMHLCELEGANNAFFIGDDVTDEDVFSLPDSHRVFSVRVGQSRRSHARYFIRDQHEIDRLLERLLEFRIESELGVLG